MIKPVVNLPRVRRGSVAMSFAAPGLSAWFVGRLVLFFLFAR